MSDTAITVGDRLSPDNGEKPSRLGRFFAPLIKAIQSSPLTKRAYAFAFPENEQRYSDPNFDFLAPDRIIRTGMTIVAVFVVVLFGWGAFAPLGSAIVAQGVVVVESHRKPIQHLEGGIVRKVYVNEGQIVAPGQLLVQMDDTEARASLDLVKGEISALAAQQARLEAERDNATAISFPPELLAHQDDPKISEAIRGETSTFNTHRDTLQKQADIYMQRIGENDKIIAGLQKQQQSIETQNSLIAEETVGSQTLYQKGLETLPHLLQLQRSAADLDGQRGEIVEKIAQVKLNSGEDQLEIVNLRNTFLGDVVKDLRDVESKRFETLDKLQAALDMEARLTLRAATAGKVVGLQVHTPGTVVKPGDTLMEIVPANDQLSVEAHVRPEDADDVHAGMTARINLGAYKQRRLPMILGTVQTISADRIVDARTGQAYFVAEVLVDRSQLKGYPDVRMIPGMPVDIAIDTGNRTMLSYFIEPITGVFNRGMRER